MMASLSNYYVPCRRVLCTAAKRRKPITYGELAQALGLQSPRQQWSTVLNPIATDEVQKTGEDLTLVVVYASGPAKGLSRYFSNLRSGQAPQEDMLDPNDKQQVADYRRAREKVFDRYATVIC